MTPADAAQLDDQCLVQHINDAGGKGPVAAVAFEALYHRHKDFVLRIALQITGNDADALDAAQETFAYLLRKFPGFVLTSKLTTFLYPAAKHHAISRARRRRREISASALSSGPENGDRPADALDGLPMPACAETRLTDSRRETLHKAMSDLSPLHREVIWLRYVEDHSLEELSLMLDVPLGTVKSRLHNAIAALQQTPGIRDLLSG